jgi:hypothetical protein
MNRWPGNYDGLVQMPRLGRSGPAAGGSGSPVNHIVTPVGPTCVSFTGASINTSNTFPDGPLAGTRTAAVRRMVLVNTDNSEVVFVNTQTNAVIKTLALATAYTDGGRFKQVAFATSTQNFFFINASRNDMTVTDADGNIVGTLAIPGYTFSREGCVYSPEADRLYTFQFNGGTSSNHILEINPHTLALTRDVDTGNADDQAIFYYPNNVVLYGSFFRNFPISTLTNDKSSAFFLARGHADYDPVSNQFFVGQSFTNNIVAFDCATFTVNATITPTTNASPVEFISYNPITSVVIAYNFSMEITVINPNGNTIVCETNDFDPSGSGGDMAIDYSSGDVYLFDEDFITNPLKVFS